MRNHFTSAIVDELKVSKHSVQVSPGPNRSDVYSAYLQDLAFGIFNSFQLRIFPNGMVNLVLIGNGDHIDSEAVNSLKFLLNDLPPDSDGGQLDALNPEDDNYRSWFFSSDGIVLSDGNDSRSTSFALHLRVRSGFARVKFIGLQKYSESLAERLISKIKDQGTKGY